jgi:hypothetical protein
MNPFLTRLRRFVLLVTAAVWQGGFVFYAGVVVPAGTELHGHFGQGLVTQRVTNALNVFGLLCHAAYLWELVGSHERRKWKWILWAVSLAMLGGLVAIHAQMDALIDATGGRVGEGFRRWHIAYLWLSTGQWLIAAVLGWHTLGERQR